MLVLLNSNSYTVYWISYVTNWYKFYVQRDDMQSMDLCIGVVDAGMDFA